jgi:hypothetical protein
MALVPFQNKAAKRADDEPDWDDHEPGEDTGGKMSFLDHLDELRRRIIYSLISVLVGFGIAFFWLNDIFYFIFKPMQAVLPEGQHMIYTEPGEQFFLMFKIGLMAGLIIASPLVFSQVWLFIAPGTVCEGEEARDPVRPDGNDPVRGRRGLLALQGVPHHLEVLRDLVSRIRHVHAANRAGIFLVSTPDARHRTDVPAANARTVPRQDGADHPAVHD